MRKKIFGVIFAVAFLQLTFAQEEPTVWLKLEKVVTPVRTEVLKQNQPAVIDVITSTDIKKTNAQTLTEVLAKNSCVDIISYPGVSSVVNLRGFSPELFTNIKHHALLVDGRRAGTINLSTILLDDVERIEVLKGPASSLYGSEAMAGVINVITKKSKGKVKTKIDLEYGSFSSGKIGLVTGGNINEKFDFDFSFSRIVQGDYDVPKYSVGAWEWSGGTWKGNSYTNYSGSIRLGYGITTNQRLDLRTDMFIGKDINYAGDIFGEYGPGKKDLDRFSVDLVYNVKTHEEKHSLLSRIFIAKDNSLYYSEYDPFTWEKVTWYKSYLSYTDYIGFQVQDTIKLPFNNQLTVGIDYNQDKTVSERYTTDGSRLSPYEPDNEKINFAIFAEDKLSLLDEKLITTLGARYDDYTLKTLETPYFAGNYQPGQEKLSSFNPRGGVVVKIKDFAKLHSTVGTAFVVPKPREKAGYYTVWGKTTRGNPDLKPETSLSYDFGLEVGISHLNIDITYFHTDVKDKIQRKRVSATETTFENIGEAKMSGIENTFSFNLAKLFNLTQAVELYSNFTYLLQAKDVTNDKDLYNVAKTKANYGISYTDKKLAGRLNFRYVGKMVEPNWFTTVYIGQTEIEYGNFTVVDLNLSYAINKYLKLNFKINNLFDTMYEEKPGYPMPARTILAGVSLQL